MHHFAKNQGIEGLVLGRGRDILAHCKVTQILPDFSRTHILRVTLIVKEDKAANPAHISFFGTQAVMAVTDRVTNAIQQTRLVHDSHTDCTMKCMGQPKMFVSYSVRV